MDHKPVGEKKLLQNAEMEDILTKVERVAEGNASVLLFGESGVGKSCLRAQYTALPSVVANPSSQSIAPPSQNNYWNQSCSGTLKVLSQERSKIIRVPIS